MTREYKMTIGPDKLEQTRKFFRERGGVVLWKSQDLSDLTRPELMTPATHEDGSKATPPHWAYGDPEPLKPEDICVRTRTPVEPPLAWFPVCTCCEGTGRYPLSSIAEARGCTIEELPELQHISTHPDAWDRDAQDTIKCSACFGTGHTNRHIHIRVKRHWTGIMEVVGRVKPDKLAKKLGTRVQWDFTCVGYGRAEVYFFRETIVPFTLED